MEKNKGTGRIAIALIIIFIGALFLLRNVGILVVGPVIGTFWPMILVIIGLVQIFTRGKDGMRSGLTLLVLGLVFQMMKLDIMPWGFGQYWPILVVLFGLWILFRPERKKSEKQSGPVFSSTPPSGSHEGSSYYSSESAWGSDSVNMFTMFSGRTYAANSRQFLGGETTTIFGGTEIDLRTATLPPEGATLHVTVLFGGTDIYVPHDMPVDMNVTPVFGGSDDERMSRPAVAPGSPVLRIRGEVFFGGVDLQN